MKKRNKADITVELMRRLVEYNPLSGEFIWKKRTPDLFEAGHFTADKQCQGWNARYAETKAFGCIGAQGYYKATFFKVSFYAHRVAWAIHYGEIPSLEIDHINRDRSDNRIENLRLADRLSNAKNQTAHRDSRTGVKGVIRCRTKKTRFSAHLMVDGKRINLGRFNDLDSARRAYLDAAKKHHGEFASDGF